METKKISTTTSNATEIGLALKKILSLRTKILKVRIKLESLMDNYSSSVSQCPEFIKKFNCRIPHGNTYFLDMIYYRWGEETSITLDDMINGFTSWFYKRETGRKYRGHIDTRCFDYNERELLIKQIDPSDNFVGFTDLFLKNISGSKEDNLKTSELVNLNFGNYLLFLKSLINYYDTKIIPAVKEIAEDTESFYKDDVIKKFLQGYNHNCFCTCSDHFLLTLPLSTLYMFLGMEKRCILKKINYIEDKLCSNSFQDEIKNATEKEIDRIKNDFSDFISKDYSKTSLSLKHNKIENFINNISKIE